jgi:ribosomal protein L24
VRNVKPRSRDEQGQQKRVESPIHHSNVMHYSQAKGVRSRIGFKVRRVLAGAGGGAPACLLQAADAGRGEHTPRQPPP